jgi:WD40 repeat protein
MAQVHDAFISYSHQADTKLATAIESGLERLAKPLLSLRAMDVFRDQTTLTATPALWPSILKHLSDSRWFILLACPQSAQSPWCVKETSWWLENRNLDTLLVVLTGGEICWNPKGSDFDWTRTTALSQSLASKFSDEPLYVDLCWTADQRDLGMRNARFRDDIVSLAAPIRGMTRDELDSADKRQLRWNKALVRGLQTGLGIVTILALLAAAYAMAQKRQALSDAALARAQAHASKALLSARTRPLSALESAIAASDTLAEYPTPGILETAALWALSVDGNAPPAPLEAEIALRQSVVLSRLRAVFIGPAGATVDQMDASAENSLVVVRLSDSSVVVIDATSESVIARRESGKEPVDATFLMSTGTQVLIVDRRGRVTVWELDNGNERAVADLSPDEKASFSVTAQRDFVVRQGKVNTSIISLKDGRALTAKPCRGVNTMVAAVTSAGIVKSIHTGGRRLAICDLASGRILESITTDAVDLTDVAVSADGKYLATASTNETIRTWHLPSKREIEVFRGHTAVPMALAFGADSRRLSVGIADGNVLTWRLRTDASSTDQQDQMLLATGGDGSVHQIAEVDGGKRIVTTHSTTGRRQYLRIWSGPLDVDVTPVEEPDEVFDAMIDNSGGRVWLLTTASLAGYGVDGRRQTVVKRESTSPMSDWGFSSNGRYAFATDDNGGVQTWSIEDPPRTRHWQTGKPIVQSQIIGGCCLLALLHDKGELSIYDLRQSDSNADVMQLGADVKSVHFGGGTDRMLLNKAAELELHVSNQPIRRLDSDIRLPARGSAFTAEGRALLSLSRLRPALLDAIDSKHDHFLSGHAAEVIDGEVSPDGSRVVTASNDWTARVWDSISGAQVSELRGHNDAVYQVRFRQDGRLIATAGLDGTVRLWDPIGGDQLQRIEVGLTRGVKILAFAEKHLLISANDKLRLYRCLPCQQSAELLQEARRLLKAGVPRELVPGNASSRAK